MDGVPQVYHVRSIKEQHAVFDLNPCSCGTASRSSERSLLEQDGQWISRFEWSCPKCGVTRCLDFLFPDDDGYRQLRGYGPPDEPSRALDAAQFLWISDYWAGRTPESADSPEVAAAAARTIREAIAALEEVLKFIGPAADDQAPPSAFWSSYGQQAFARDADQYLRYRLEPRLEGYQRRLATFRSLAPSQPSVVQANVAAIQASPGQASVAPSQPSAMQASGPAPSASAPEPSASAPEPSASAPEPQAPPSSHAERLALWLTLAYIDISSADGNICDLETEHWKKTLAANNLPNMVEQLGLDQVMARYQAGELEPLSHSFAGLPYDLRKMLVTALTSMVIADGSADMREIERARAIAGWVGIPF